MAHAITFKPKPVDYHQELMQRVQAAPKDHAEALLVLWDVLQLSHDTGVLELAKGLIGGKDIIAGKLAESAALPESVAAIRNAIAMARILGSIDPDVLQRMAKGLDDAGKAQKKEEKAPTIWQLIKRTLSEDGRRGISFTTHLLQAWGSASKG